MLAAVSAALLFSLVLITHKKDVVSFVFFTPCGAIEQLQAHWPAFVDASHNPRLNGRPTVQQYWEGRSSSQQSCAACTFQEALIWSAVHLPPQWLLCGAEAV